MGQSQPSYAASASQCDQHKDEILTMTLMKKIGNVKMVPFDIFQSMIVESELERENNYLFNEENCSIYERELPKEIFINILQFLPPNEIVKLGRVCKNFEYYWIQNWNLWKFIMQNEERNDSAPLMYFRPIIGSSIIQSIIYYHSYFVPLLKNSFKHSNQTTQIRNTLKVILLGPEMSGKSSILQRIKDQEIPADYAQTVGVDFAIIQYQLSDGDYVKMQYWDTSGQPTFAKHLRAYTRGVNVIVFCFDLNDEKSFSIMKERIEIYRNENFSDTKWNENLNETNVTLLIIGMKRDLERKVSMHQVKEYMDQLVKVDINGILMHDLKIQYFELSNKIDSKAVIEFPFMYGLASTEEYILRNRPVPEPVFGNLPPKK